MTLITQSVLRFVPVCVMTLLVAVLSLLPAHCFKQVVEPLPLLPNIDKIVHALMYASLTAAYMYALTNERLRNLTAVLKIALFVTLYGAVIEVCQNLFTTSRSMEMLDIIANAAGAFTSSLLIYAWLRHRATRIPSSTPAS